MANEFIARKGFISLDSAQVTGSLSVTGNISASIFSGSFVGNGSQLTGVSAGFPFTGSAGITGSLVVVGPVNATSFTGSLQGIATSASYVQLANVNGFTAYSASINTAITPQTATVNTGSSPLTLTTQSIVVADSTNGNLIINLPDLNTVIGTPNQKPIVVYKNDYSQNVIYVNPSGSQLVNGASQDIIVSIQLAVIYNPTSAGWVTEGTSAQSLAELELFFLQLTETGSFATTGSNVFIGNQIVTGSLTVTGGITGNITGSATSASYVEYTNVANKPTLVSSSAQIVGYNIFATTGSNQFNGSQAITGSLTVTGQVVAQTLNVQQVTSSIVYSSGSNIFGNSLGNTQQFTGSVSVTGSLTTSIAAFGSAATTFLTSDSGTIKSRTAAQTLSDIAALPLAGGTLTGALVAGTGLSAQNNIGTVNLGKSGTDYPLFGYNIRYTGTNGLYQYDSPDISWAFSMGNTSSSFRLKYAVSGTAGNTITYLDRYIIDSSGNHTLKTGTVTLENTLSGTSAAFSGAVNLSSASTTTQLILTGADTTNQRLEVTDGTITNRFGIFGRTNGDSGVIGTQTNHSLLLQTNNTTRLTISNTGAATFDTTGAINATFNSTNASGGYIALSRSSSVKGYLGIAAQLLVGGVNDIELRSGANLFLTAVTDLKLYSRDVLALTLGASQAATFAGAATFASSVTATDGFFLPSANVAGVRYLTSGENTNTGATGRVMVLLQNVANSLVIEKLSTGFTSSGIRTQAGSAIYDDGAGGLSIGATNGSGTLRLFAGNAEGMRITSGGYTKITNDGTFLSIASPYHENVQNSNGNQITYFYHGNSNPYGIETYFGYAPNNGTNFFARFRDGSASRALIYSNGGLANYQTYNTNLSDERTKKDIEPLESYWDKFKAIEIVKFKYKDQTHDDYNIGVIAQQVESVAPEFVDVDGWGETVEGEEPLKSIYTADLHHATIKVLQECMSKIEEQQSQIESLKAEIQTLKQ